MNDDQEGSDGVNFFELLEHSEEWLTYESWRLEESAQGQPPTVRFTYKFSGARTVVCTLQLPPEAAAALAAGPTAVVQSALFHVGLVVLTWVWMNLPTTDVRIAAGFLSQEQVEFWEWFYRHTFAEYAAVNNLPEEQICVKLTVTCHWAVPAPEASCENTDAPEAPALERTQTRRVLCPLGGGKDSLVACALLAAQLGPASGASLNASRNTIYTRPVAHEALGAANPTPLTSLSWLYVADVVDGADAFRDGRRLPALVRASGLPCLCAGHDFGYRDLAACGRSKAPCGHPWAALVCFDALAVSLLLGFGFVAVGNERSANFGNGVWVGAHEVNHQFDKSFAFEARAHAYIKAHFKVSAAAHAVAVSSPSSSAAIAAPDDDAEAEADAILQPPPSPNGVHYFSALQPLWEVQIAWLFARGLARGGVLCCALRVHRARSGVGTEDTTAEQTKGGALEEGEQAGDRSLGHPFLNAFISCNEGDGHGDWCARCDKCCFVFALLAAWLPPEEVARRIFKGRNLLADASLLPSFRALAVPGGRTPFDCVGTREEARLSLWLARRRLCRRRSCAAPLPSGRDNDDGCERCCVLEGLSAELDGAGELLPLLVDPAPGPAQPPHCLPAWWRWRSPYLPMSHVPSLAGRAEEAYGFAWTTEIMLDALGD